MADPYTNQANLIKAYSRELLIKLADDYGTGDIVTEHITAAIAKADNEIDMHCRGRYPADMDTADVPEVIVNFSNVLTIYNLYDRRLTLTMPESLKLSYKAVIKSLEKIQSGKLTPWPSDSEPSILLSNKTSTSKKFSTTYWESYLD